MKVLTVTFQNADNYGAMLQTYALQKTISGMGHEVEVLNYYSKYMSEPWSIAAFRKKGLVRYVLGVGYYFLRLLRKAKFDKFRKKKLNITKKFNKENLYEISNAYEKYITGSDQIWNLNITNNDYTYFLDFVFDESKIISYAASFGNDVLNHNEENKKISKCLNRFHMISTRENSGIEIIKKISGRSSVAVLDPTMLLRRDEWDKLIPDNSLKNDYILIYQTTFSKNLIALAKTLSKKYGLNIISIPFPMGGALKASTNLTAGPLEWLELIKNAKFVVTDSFHGTVFSIIYEVEFNVVISEGGTRIIELLRNLGIENRIVKDEFNCTKINWSLVNTKLEPLREISVKYISESLNT